MMDLLKSGWFLLMEAYFLPEAHWGSPWDYQLLLKPGDIFMAGGNGPTSSHDLPCCLPGCSLVWGISNSPAFCRNEQFSKNHTHLIQI